MLFKTNVAIKSAVCQNWIIAAVCTPPAEIWHQLVNPPTTETGLLVLVVVLFPRRPMLLFPHAHALPPVLRAAV